MNTRSMLIAAAISGIVMAMLSVLPIVNTVNCCCFVGFWGGGILAVLLYRMLESGNPELDIGQGILLGLVAGLIGALCDTFFRAATSLLFTGLNTASYFSHLESIPGMSENLPENSRQMLSQFGSVLSGGIFQAVCNFIVYPFFAIIGSLIGTALIWKKK